MLNNQDFMEVGCIRNDFGSLGMQEQGISRKVDEDHLVNGLKWEDDYYDHHDHTDIHLQIVPEIHKDEENLKQDLLAVPDEHSETGDYHHPKYISNNPSYCRNKHKKHKRRRIQTSGDEDSREVPTLTQTNSKRRTNEMSKKIRKLQKLVPNCHKTDKIRVLDKAIEHIKNLKLQLQVSTMGMNPCFPPATFGFGMHNHLLTAMDMAHGLIPPNQTAASPSFPALNWSLPKFTNLVFPYTLVSPPPEHLYGLAPCSPRFLSFPTNTNGRI